MKNRGDFFRDLWKKAIDSQKTGETRAGWPKIEKGQKLAY
jgi:hypothetical protein